MKKRLKIFNFFLSITILFCFGVMSSCSKMNDLHDIYLKNGEILYASKPDSVAIFPGYNRVKLKCWQSDLKVKSLLIYWDLRADSMEVNIPNSRNDDGSFDIYIEDLEERDYSFELIAMNRDRAQKSMTYNVSTNVYGDNFANNRIQSKQIKYVILDNSNIATIHWAVIPPKVIGSEVTIENSSNEKSFYFFKNTDVTSVIPAVDESDRIFYRTLVLPDSNAIDTLYTPFEQVSLLKTVDKSKFSRWNPPGFPYKGSNHVDWVIENLWDGNLGRSFNSASLDFTFDMGQVVKIGLLKAHARNDPAHLYNGPHAKRFQIWGSNIPQVENSFSNWSLLGEFSSVKPSRAPLGTNTTIDRDYAWRDGEDFYLDKNAPAVRYIRLVCLDTWGGITTNVMFAEINLFEIL